MNESPMRLEHSPIDQTKTFNFSNPESGFPDTSKLKLKSDDQQPLGSPYSSTAPRPSPIVFNKSDREIELATQNAQFIAELKTRDIQLKNLETFIEGVINRANDQAVQSRTEIEKCRNEIHRLNSVVECRDTTIASLEEKNVRYEKQDSERSEAERYSLENCTCMS